MPADGFKLSPQDMARVQTDALGVFQEECAEAIVAASKAKRFGLDSEHEPYGTAREMLHTEVRDIMVLVSVLVSAGVLDMEVLQDPVLIDEKKARLRRFTNFPGSLL